MRWLAVGPKPCGANANFTNLTKYYEWYYILRGIWLISEIGFAELKIRIKKSFRAGSYIVPFIKPSPFCIMHG
jgi:hypothetical protein